MNQILGNEIFNDIAPISHKSIVKYKVLFYISVTLLSFFFIYYTILYYNINIQSKTSEKILNAYEIQTLYSTNNISPRIILENGESADILGILEIKKFNLKYPILSNFSDELLKYSICKFYGNSLDSIGNFCIVGHNYNNETFFSNINQLELGDLINIYSINRHKFKIYCL